MLRNGNKSLEFQSHEGVLQDVELIGPGLDTTGGSIVDFPFS